MTSSAGPAKLPPALADLAAGDAVPLTPEAAIARLKTPALSEQLQVVACVLREARQEAGLSQRSLAQRLGKANSHVSKIESGLRRVDALELYRIADAFGLPPLALFERIAAELFAPEGCKVSSDVSTVRLAGPAHNNPNPVEIQTHAAYDHASNASAWSTFSVRLRVRCRAV